MRIDLIISADYIREDIIKDKTVVVIDMLRATSVITTALINGCKEVIPLLTVEESREKKEELGAENCVLGGERKAVKIEGFDFGNSPLEYSKDNILGKTLILTTTNGTRSLTRCNSASEIYIGCMLNAKALARKLVSENKDVVIVNAGTNGQFSMDDYICSGFIINEAINESYSSGKIELTDIAISAYRAYKDNSDIRTYIKDARHYNVMMGLGLQKDIEYCIQKNITDIVPIYSNGVIKIS